MYTSDIYLKNEQCIDLLHYSYNTTMKITLNQYSLSYLLDTKTSHQT